MSGNTLATTIGGNSVSVKEGTYKYDDTIDLRSTLEATVIDSTGNASYQVGEEVVFADSVLGTRFTGYIDDMSASNLTPNATNNLGIKCVDQHSLADRAYSKKDYESQYAGDIFSDLCSTYLAHQGVVANYAIRHDTTPSQFNEGILNNVVGASNVADGDLELASAGTDLAIVENTTAEFATGTLTNVTASNNTLVANSIPSIKYSASMNVPGLTGPISITKIWSGSYTLTTDWLQYYVWIDPSSPEIKAAIDLVFSDGSTLRDQATFTNVDLNDLYPYPTQDLAGYADGQWYYRLIYIGNFSGKTLSYVTACLGGSKVGTYTAYFRAVNITDGGATTRQALFNTTLATAQQMQTVGYTTPALTVVSTYDLQLYPGFGGIAISTQGNEFHQRNSSSYSTDATKLLQGSIISWTAAEPGNSSTDTPKTKVRIRARLDNGAFQECTNNAPIPVLLPGMNLAGRSITIREDLHSLAGASPEIAPTLTSLSIQLQSAATCSKTDATYTTSFSGSETGAVFTNTVGNTGISTLNLQGATRSWDDNSQSANETFYGGTAGTTIYQRALQFGNPSANNESKMRFDFAGQWQNFTAEIDVQVVSDVSSGLVYRSTNFSSSNGSYAYAAMLSTSALVLKKGTNTTGGGSATTLTTVSLTLAANGWHRLKVVVSGSTHQVYLDDVLQITKTDSSFSATGYVGCIGVSPTVAYPQINFDNFGVMPTLTGTWVTPSLSLTSVANYGNSLIFWRDVSASPSSSNVLLVEASINGGSSWMACTNGAAIPNFTAGQSLAGVSLLVRITLSSTTATAMPGLDNFEVLVIGSFSSSGNRVSPPLLLSSIVEAGSSLVSWNGLQPTNTGILIDTTLDNGATWTNIGSGASGSAPIASITTRPNVIDDTFDTNTSSSYTQTQLNSPATWTWDTANSRLVATGGSNALLKYTGLSAMNVDIMADLDEADNAGIVARVSGTTMYALILYDASAVTQNTFFLYAIVSGVFTQLATGSISFTRGVPHRFHLIATNTTITATMDGVQLASVTDNRITTAGTAGLLAGTLGRVYQLRIQPFGQNVSALSVKVRARLSSTDPTVTPQLTDLTFSCHGPNIQNGALIPSTNYSVLAGSKNTLAQDFDDLAKQSTDALGNSFLWYIDKNKVPYFQPRNATPSPWIATGTDIQLSSAPTVESSSNLYRNDEFVIGGIDIQAKTKTFTGDGSTTNWTVDYNVDSLTRVTINGVLQLIGVNGVDAGKDYYYTKGQTGITQDKSEAALVETQTILFSYNAQVPITVELRNDSAIAARAALDGTDGMVQAVDDGTGLSKAAAIQLANGLLSTQSIIGETFTFTTLRDGLAAGQLLTVFLAALGVVDAQFLITDVSTTWKTTMPNNVQVVQPFHQVTATSGPIVGGWERFMSNVIKGGIS